MPLDKEAPSRPDDSNSSLMQAGNPARTKSSCTFSIHGALFFLEQRVAIRSHDLCHIPWRTKRSARRLTSASLFEAVAPSTVRPIEAWHALAILPIGILRALNRSSIRSIPRWGVALLKKTERIFPHPLHDRKHLFYGPFAQNEHDEFDEGQLSRSPRRL